MKWFLTPTLQRRVLLAMSLALAFAWLVLAAYSLYQETDSERRESGIRNFARLISEQLLRFEDPAQATAFLGGVVRLQNEIYGVEEFPAALVAFLWDKQERLVYSSEPAGSEALHGITDAVTTATINGRQFNVLRRESPRWSLVLARAHVSERWMAITIMKDMLPQLLIAYGLIFPVMWIAVSRGLLPLRDMSRRITARDPDDLSNTNIVPRYEEMRPLQLALDGLLDRLRTKVARETAFVQEAAHELRTPMAVVSAQAHVLLLAKDDAARTEAEQRLGRALARASHLVGQLLQLAHMGGERPSNAVDVDIAHEIRAELALLVPEARQRKIEVSLQAPDALWACLEREAFKSVLHNLVGNAIRYIEPGDKIVVRLVRDVNCFLLMVADNGPGISEERRELVFERFHRGIDHTAPGAGLGLAIVKQACVRMDASVHIEKGLDGAGCQFVVRVPSVSKSNAAQTV